MISNSVANWSGYAFVVRADAPIGKLHKKLVAFIIGEYDYDDISDVTYVAEKANEALPEWFDSELDLIDSHPDTAGRIRYSTKLDEESVAIFLKRPPSKEEFDVMHSRAELAFCSKDVTDGHGLEVKPHFYEDEVIFRAVEIKVSRITYSELDG